MDLDCGPLMNAPQQRRVQGYIDRARASGVAVLAEGRIADGVAASGHWVKPTLFGPVPREHALATEEVFGPVLAAMPFDDEADAVALANATEYGLLAAVWTDSGGRQLRMAKALKVGQVFVNGYGAGGGVELPFGGTKRSGHGREKGLLALEEMSNCKTVVLYHG
jgi:aldehyde dehydrogenase (NAD+)